MLHNSDKFRTVHLYFLCQPVKLLALPFRPPVVRKTFLNRLGLTMIKPGVLTVAVSVVLLTLVSSSVRADSVNLPPGLEKLTEEQSLQFPDIGKADLTGLLAEHFANNNGKHLGFSVAAFHTGMKFGLANAPNTVSGASVTQNPEPTGMLLLGTGLAGAAAYARRKRRRL